MEKLCFSDLHVHTNLSLCAPKDTTVASFLPLCEQDGTRILGISNHLYAPKRLSCTYPENLAYALKIKEEVAALTPQTSVKILIGCEVETFYGQPPGLNREDAATFDYLLLAASHIFNFPGEYQHLDLTTPEKVKKLLIEQFIRACLLEYDKPVGICHPLYPICCPFEQEVMDSFTDSEYETCFSLAAERNVSIEIHACFSRGGTRLDESGLSPSYLHLLEVAKDCGCKFHFGSDAHAPGGFLEIHKKLELAAKRLGITQEDLWEVATAL